MSSYYNKREQKEALMKKLLIIIPIAIVVLGLVFGALHVIDNKSMGGGEDEGGEISGNTMPATIEYDGKTYQKKTNVKSYLFIGDDAADPNDDMNEGLCDVLALLVIDQNAKSYTVMPINRNTLTDIPAYDEEGNVYGTSQNLQLAFAHSAAYSDDVACKNTVDVVSALLNDIYIDGFYNLNMHGIQKLNHLVNGVEVHIDEDLTAEDAAFKEGSTIKLTDEQAEKFVRGRKKVSDGTNESRMERQNEYLRGFKAAFKNQFQGSADIATVITEELGEYGYTDLTGGDMNKLAKAFMDYTENPQLEITGEVGTNQFMDIEWATFTPDKKSIDENVVKLFYREKK